MVVAPIPGMLISISPGGDGPADGLRSLATPQGIDGPVPRTGEPVWPVTFGVPPGRAGDRPGGRPATHAVHRAVRALGCPRRRRMAVI